MKIKIILWMFVLFVLSSLTYALIISSGTTYTPSESNVTYIIGTTITADSISLDNICLNITGGVLEGNYCNISLTPLNITLSYSSSNFLPTFINSSNEVLYMKFDNTLDDSSTNDLNSSYRILGKVGYDFRLNENSKDVFGSIDGTDVAITYNYEGASFDGSASNITIGNSVNNYFLDSWSIGGEFYLDSTSGTYPRIFSFHHTDMSGLDLFYYSDTGRIGVQYGNGTYGSFLLDDPLTKDAFHNVFVTYNSTTGNMSIYVDGQINKTADQGLNIILSNTINTQIGDSPSYGNLFTGKIKNLFIYNATLSPTQILDIYDTGNYTNSKISLTNKSIELNGIDEYVDLENFTRLDEINSNNLTISALVKLNEDYDFMSVVNKREAYSLGIRYNKLAVYDWSTSNWRQTGITLLNDSEWHHIVVTYNNNVGQFYLDGSTDGTTFDFTSDTNNYNLVIGGTSHNTVEYFNGNIDEVLILNESLSSSQVSSLWDIYSTLYLTSNLSLLTQTNTDFDINISVYNANSTATCTVLSNNSNVTCESENTNLDSVGITCSVTVTGEYVNLTPSCNTTSEIANATSYNVLVDNINPVITLTNWTENKTAFINNLTGNFLFSDTELFSYNITVDGINFDSETNIVPNSYPYNFTIDPKNLLVGLHTLFIEIADGHTAQKIEEYLVKKGGFFDDSYLNFKTPDGNEIEISANDKKSNDVFNTIKEEDRYTFTFKPYKDLSRTDIIWEDAKASIDNKLIEDDTKLYKTIKFKIKCKNNIYIIDKPNTKIKKWLVCGNQWIDFLSNEANNNLVTYLYDYSLNDPFKTVIATIYYSGDINEPIQFNSIGNLNFANYTTYFYTTNYTTSFVASEAEGKSSQIDLYINVSTTPVGFNNFSVTLYYNNSLATTTKTLSSNIINFSSIVTTPNVTSEQNISFYFNITLNNLTSTLLQFNQSVFPLQISQNCTLANFSNALTMCGYQEQSPKDNVSDMLLNMNLDVLDGIQIIKQFGFSFDNQTCYNICISPNSSSYKVNAKMEYGDGNYTDRKYYLNNYTLDSTSDTLSLYHLEDSIASDIILTVYDKQTGDRIEGAYVKILRYYPNENNDTSSGFRTVEVEKTDVNGQTLAKMILADVWYKFIIEYPAGNVIYTGDIEKMLTTDKLLPVSLSTGNLLTYNELFNINGDVSCTWLSTPPTCTFIWNNPAGTDVTGYLKIYQDTGFRKVSIFEDSITSPAASITYQITENTTNKKYIAEGWID